MSDLENWWLEKLSGWKWEFLDNMHAEFLNQTGELETPLLFILLRTTYTLLKQADSYEQFYDSLIWWGIVTNEIARRSRVWNIYSILINEQQQIKYLPYFISETENALSKVYLPKRSRLLLTLDDLKICHEYVDWLKNGTVILLNQVFTMSEKESISSTTDMYWKRIKKWDLVNLEQVETWDLYEIIKLYTVYTQAIPSDVIEVVNIATGESIYIQAYACKKYLEPFAKDITQKNIIIWSQIKVCDNYDGEDLLGSYWKVIDIEINVAGISMLTIQREDWSEFEVYSFSCELIRVVAE